MQWWEQEKETQEQKVYFDVKLKQKSENLRSIEKCNFNFVFIFGYNFRFAKISKNLNENKYVVKNLI